LDPALAQVLNQRRSLLARGFSKSFVETLANLSFRLVYGHYAFGEASHLQHESAWAVKRTKHRYYAGIRMVIARDFLSDIAIAKRCCDAAHPGPVARQIYFVAEAGEWAR